MPSTTRAGFNTVTQAGSWGTWASLSNIELPVSGDGITNANVHIELGSRTNNIFASAHEGLAAIPVGSTFDSMSLGKSVRRLGMGEIDFFGRMADNTFGGFIYGAVAWSNIDVTESFVESFAAGDRAFWDLEHLTPTQVMDRLKGGTLHHYIWAVENIGVSNKFGDASQARLRDLTLVVNYTEPAAGGSPGRRGAVLIGF